MILETLEVDIPVILITLDLEFPELARLLIVVRSRIIWRIVAVHNNYNSALNNLLPMCTTRLLI